MFYTEYGYEHNTVKFGNFRKDFTFANSTKRHICDFKKSLLENDLPISLNDSDFSIARGFYSRNFAYAKIKPSRNFRIYSM